METKETIVHSWSGGKDSSMALYEIIKEGRYRPKYLLTTVNKDYGRVSMHGVRSELAEEQARSIGIKLDVSYLSSRSSNEEYERVMREKLLRYKVEGIRKVSFGDIFLEDIRKYRESKMNELEMECIFPIWGRNTKSLAREIISLGFRAIICTVDSRKLSKDFAGREFDAKFLQSLPAGVDPCGENGEFHTFVYDGPIFKWDIRVKIGETVLRDSFYFTDLIPL